MKIAVLDDYSNAFRSMPSFERLKGHEVVVYHDTVKDTARLAERLHDVDAVVLTQERSSFRRSLIEKLPKLKLVAQTGSHRGHFDIDACNGARHRHRVPEWRRNELFDGGTDVGSRSRGAQTHPVRIRTTEARRLAIDHRHQPARQDARHLRPRQDRHDRGRGGQNVRDEGHVLGARERRRRKHAKRDTRCRKAAKRSSRRPTS